ncbi:hypothetical protein [Pseudomonas sp. AF32]|uniref:hypothetical protein n=1 Tax=Pseudomonas sp. AF32 TaxID=554390 RepID=UPI0031B56ED3
MLGDPGVLGCLPLIQRPANLFLPSFQGVPHALALGVDFLRHLFQLGDELLADVVQGSLGTGYLVRHRGDCIPAFAGRDVGYKAVDLGTDLLKPRLQAIRRAVDGKGSFCGRHYGQFGICGHERILAATCAALERLVYWVM